mmetsp:Transcript_2367/g.3958  ORF Transcript_2367/g.3958 Transcript_2367/m.3958 type:complete len:243 (-) Transcript_2367:472-1200(-)
MCGRPARKAQHEQGGISNHQSCCFGLMAACVVYSFHERLKLTEDEIKSVDQGRNTLECKNRVMDLIDWSSPESIAISNRLMERIDLLHEYGCRPNLTLCWPDKPHPRSVLHMHLHMQLDQNRWPEFDQNNLIALALQYNEERMVLHLMTMYPSILITHYVGKRGVDDDDGNLSWAAAIKPFLGGRQGEMHVFRPHEAHGPETARSRRQVGMGGCLIRSGLGVAQGRQSGRGGGRSRGCQGSV